MRTGTGFQRLGFISLDPELQEMERNVAVPKTIVTAVELAIMDLAMSS